MSSIVRSSLAFKYNLTFPKKNKISVIKRDNYYYTLYSIHAVTKITKFDLTHDSYNFMLITNDMILLGKSQEDFINNINLLKITPFQYFQMNNKYTTIVFKNNGTSKTIFLCASSEILELVQNYFCNFSNSLSIP